MSRMLVTEGGAHHGHISLQGEPGRRSDATRLNHPDGGSGRGNCRAHSKHEAKEVDHDSAATPDSPVVPTEGPSGSAPSPDLAEETSDLIIQDTPVIDATKVRPVSDES